MKTININQLQSQISRVMKDVEGGETYEVMRYSRPIAVVLPKGKRTSESRCDECIAKLDDVMRAVKTK